VNVQLRRPLAGKAAHGRVLSGWLLVTLSVTAVSRGELPKQLQDALAQSHEAGEEMQAAGVLRRYANSDEAKERVLSRTALARIDRKAGHPQRAQTWVKEYSQPIAANYEWPRVLASIEYAQSAFDLGQTFDAVKRLNGIKDHSQGLGRIHAQRALSLISEQQPDLQKALAFEKGALSTGKKYFKREKISDSAGLADLKPGHGQWKRLKPQIDERIKELERLLDIEKYGLDYVLYREAQMYRKADHPLAMDFTHVAAAFRLKKPMANKVPGADYEKALETYSLLIESFEQNPYAEAAKLYSAVCKVHMGKADQAIRDLKAFYKENPDGLYRGEALRLIGDIYLFHKWDRLNAEEAYKRSVNWLESIKGKSRILSDYLAPEKSQKVSKPPVRVKVLTEEGQIKDISIPPNALVNRNSSKWYLDGQRVDVEWCLGYLNIILNNWTKAEAFFANVKEYDHVIREADRKRIFNAYERMKIAKKHKSMVGFAEQNIGLTGNAKNVIYWADIQYMSGDFVVALDIYEKIRDSVESDDMEYGRAVLGKFLVKREMGSVDVDQLISEVEQVIDKNPKSGSIPMLLELCALYTKDEPETARKYFRKIYEEYPESKFAARAMFNEIISCLDWSAHSERKMMIEEFKRRYPENKNHIKSLKKLDGYAKEVK